MQHILDKHNKYENNAVAEEKADSSTKQIRVPLDHLHLIASAIYIWNKKNCNLNDNYNYFYFIKHSEGKLLATVAVVF